MQPPGLKQTPDLRILMSGQRPPVLKFLDLLLNTEQESICIIHCTQTNSASGVQLCTWIKTVTPEASRDVGTGASDAWIVIQAFIYIYKFMTHFRYIGTSLTIIFPIRLSRYFKNIKNIKLSLLTFNHHNFISHSNASNWFGAIF